MPVARVLYGFGWQIPRPSEVVADTLSSLGSGKGYNQTIA